MELVAKWVVVAQVQTTNRGRYGLWYLLRDNKFGPDVPANPRQLFEDQRSADMASRLYSDMGSASGNRYPKGNFMRCTKLVVRKENRSELMQRVVRAEVAIANLNDARREARRRKIEL